jgi:hypothetical protein
MRSYVIDEVQPPDMAKVRDFLRDHAIPSELGDIFWVPIPDALLNEKQYQHRECRPHVSALELGDTWVRMECFVRSLKGMRCECQGYCTHQQILFLINFAHAMLDDLGIKT